MIRAVIVDDEALARQVIREYLQDEPDIEVVAEFGEPLKALEALSEMRPDVLFLDIQMPVMNGFELLESLSSPPVVIFCTAYDEYALQAFDACAVDYLLKPFSPERFHQAVERARKQLRSEKITGEYLELIRFVRQHSPYREQFLVKKGKHYRMISVHQITWIQAQEDYCMIYTREGEKYLLSHSMQEMEKILDPEKFIRVHRSAMVQFEWIREVHPWSSGRLLLILSDGTRIETSRSGAKAIKKRQL